MFGIRTVKSGIREQEKYYTQDESLSQSKGEHYAAEQKQSRFQSHSQHNSINNKLTTAIFHGLGAAKLGLKGAVTKEEFKSLFYGYKPGTTERIRNNRQNIKTQENLAEDITLSSSKSFSIALHQGGDERLFDAHVETVKEIADVIEAKYIQTRESVNGKHQRVNTGNMISALIPHHTSRDGDMQLHTHLVIFNGTQRADGKYCAMKNVDLNRQKWLGNLYQSILAQKVQKLGYSIRETKDGFELEGIQRSQIEAFSKRSRAIIKKLTEEGKEINHQNRDRAALTTRKAKNITQTLEEYREQWRIEAKAHGIKAPIPKTEPVIPKQKQTAKEALDSAISHLSEPSVSFRRDEVHEYIYQSGLQSFSLSELETEIAHHPQLIALNNEATEFTTVKATAREIDTAKQWLKGQNKAIPLLSDPQVEATKLNQGQAEAIKRTLTSTDKYQIIHGLSGVGKTTALGILRNELRETDIVIKGFAPTVKAAETLGEELNIQTNTVAHLALATPENKANQLWIIDEAGLMSAKDAQTIIKKAQLAGARLLLVGDKGQNSSIEAGSPLRSLMKHGATTHSISEIIRQRNSVQKQAVELIAEGKGTEALELLEEKGYVTEIENKEERISTVAREYLKLSPQERLQTSVLTGTNRERLAITQEIRMGLEAEGQIGKSISTVQLTSRNLSKEQRSFINNYREGDYIQLFREYKGTNLKKGQLYKVERIENNGLVVRSHGGRLYRFDPAKYRDKQVFTSKKIEMAVGDKLRWTSGSDKKKGQINGKQVTVKAIDELSVTVEDNQNRVQKVSLLQPLPLDHNLVSTSYRAQGQSKKRVIVSATNDPTSSLEPFYVKISRQTTDLKVYTESLEQLREWVQKSNVQRNPIELIENHYGRQNRGNSVTVKRATTGKSEAERATSPIPAAERRIDPERLESVYSGVDRTFETEEKQRTQRANQSYDGKNGIATEDDRELSDAFSHRGGVVLQNLDNLANAITQCQLTLIAKRGAGAIASYQEENCLIEALEKTQDLVRQFERDLQLQKLDVLEKAIEEKRTVKLQGLEELADAISNHKTEETIAQTMTVFNQSVEKLQQQLRQKLDRINDSLSQNKNAIASSNPNLRSLSSSIKQMGGDRPFWQPIYTTSKPEHTEQHHWEEYRQSAIHPDLSSLNAISLKGYTPHEYLLYDLPNTDRLNTGRIRSGLLARYAHLEDGGWWGKAGTDALSLENIQPGEKPSESPWGCFKPDSPRIDGEKSAVKGKTKHIKYETPPKTERVPFLPDVSDAIAEKIYQKHGINPTPAERESGFWFVVKQYPKQIPITITEGFKKTLSSLSQGEVTIGLSGVNHIYKSNENGKKLAERELNPQVAIFAHSDREFRFAYDQDTKVKTIINVRRDMVRGIELLEAKGSKVKVVKWNAANGKGLDDLIAETGPLAYTEAQKNAVSSAIDKKIHYRIEYNKLAGKIRSSLENISENRLNLEVFVAAVLKGDKHDGSRVVGESDKVRQLKKQQPQLVDSYLYAIKRVAGTYLNMSSKKIPDLDKTADKMVRQQVAEYHASLQQEQHNVNRSLNLEWER